MAQVMDFARTKKSDNLKDLGLHLSRAYGGVGVSF